MATGEVSIGSDLERKKWLREGLIQAASTSFWGPYTGKSSDAVIYQENNEGAAAGHTVVFDFSGKISGKAIKGKNQAYGNGEIKRKFSDKITVERYRIPVDNGDKFDGVNIGDLSINEHSDSRAKLADLFIRWKDQMIFDALQGGTTGNPSHIIETTTAGAFTYDDLLKIETILKTGKGYTSGIKRAPLEPFRIEGGKSVWLVVLDSAQAAALKGDAKYQSLVVQGDVRGANNRVISGLIGKLGNLLIVEGPDFFGYTDGSGQFGLEDSEVEIAGLRQYDDLGVWSGQATFDEATANSRGLILGQGACQTAFGKMPDYKFQESTDFGITSESAVEYWTAAKRTNLKLEGGSVYKEAKISGLDYGVVALDMKHA